MRIRCECGWEKEVKDELIGKKAQCPKCKATMILAPYTPPTEISALDSAKKTAGQAAAAMGGLLSRGFTSITTRSTPNEVVPTSVDTELARLTADAQDPVKTAAVVAKVRAVLMIDERLLYVAIQARPVVNLFPDAVVLTDKRVMTYHPKMLGRVDFEDYVWRDLYDCRLQENMIGATLTFTIANGAKLEMDYLPKPQARQLYRIAQEREQASLEERRQRKLEEQRAAAGGGVTIQTAINAVPTAPAAPVAADPMAKLSQLKQMLDAGLITPEEFAEKKASILALM